MELKHQRSARSVSEAFSLIICGVFAAVAGAAAIVHLVAAAIRLVISLAGSREGCARSAPDGYTLVFVNLSTMAINPHVYGKPGYAISDFTPVTNMASTTNLICVNPAVQAKTMTEFMALANAKPGSLTYATAGNGSENHLMGELLKSMAGIDLVHVPYKGGGPAVIATIGGEVTSIVADPLSALSHVKAGKLRALAVTSAKRVRALPDVPTIAESGVPGYEATGWRGLVLPKGTPTSWRKCMQPHSERSKNPQ